MRNDRFPLTLGNTPTAQLDPHHILVLSQLLDQVQLQIDPVSDPGEIIENYRDLAFIRNFREEGFQDGIGHETAIIPWSYDHGKRSPKSGGLVAELNGLPTETWSNQDHVTYPKNSGK
jgi:hypothetical protein